jgi:hypothetical protein
MKRLSIYPFLALAMLLLCACSGDKQPPANEAGPQIETESFVTEEGAVTSAVIVEKSSDESEAAFITATEVKSLSAKVVFIDLESRDVILAGKDGIELELTASDDTLNLEQVKPGDTVNALIVTSVNIELVKGENLPPAKMSSTEDVQAEEGAMPARMEVDKTVQVYKVMAIDQQANTFELENADGLVEKFTASNPANLAKAAVGDSVVVTIIEALAVELVKTSAE